MGNNLNNTQNNSNEINNLRNELSKSKKIIEQQKLTIADLQNKLNNYNNTISNLNNKISNYQKIISQKEVELNNLSAQSNNVNNNIPNKFGFNDILCVNFISPAQNIHFAVSCLKTNILLLKLKKNYINNILNIEKLIIFLLKMEQ